MPSSNDRELLALLTAVVLTGPHSTTLPTVEEVPAAMTVAEEIMREAGVRVPHTAHQTHT